MNCVWQKKKRIGKDTCFAEVKGVILELDNWGYFPDAPTQRRCKHIQLSVINCCPYRQGLEEFLGPCRYGFNPHQKPLSTSDRYTLQMSMSFLTFKIDPFFIFLIAETVARSASTVVMYGIFLFKAVVLIM